MKKLAYSLVLLIGVFSVGCAYKHRHLINPVVNIPADKNTDVVGKAIHSALGYYGWVIETEAPGSITASIRKAAHSANVRVEYDQKRATIHYVSSQNLFYSKSPDGEERIHSRYMTWVDNVAKRIYHDLNGSIPMEIKVK